MRWLGTSILLLIIVLSCAQFAPPAFSLEPSIVAYDAARHPHIKCLDGRVIAETNPRLTTRERDELWREYGLICEFEWIVEDSGFTYHELVIREYPWIERLWAHITKHDLPSRELNRLVPLLDEDPRVHWASPDALLLEWCGGLEWNQSLDELKWENDEQSIVLNSGNGVVKSSSATASWLDRPQGAALLTPNLRKVLHNVNDWATQDNPPEPWPDFEYYRLCPPNGIEVKWATELASNEAFTTRCEKVYGTGQQYALDAYRKAGSPALTPITICVADTGVYINHHDLKDRLHPNSIDANYRSFMISTSEDRPRADEELSDRDAIRTTGLPRPAIQSRPAAHGTEVAGIVARCTDGFINADDDNTIRLLPASIKSEKALAFTGWRVKSPISSFVKLVACLYENYPTGSFVPSPEDPIQNTGNVRVVTISGSVPKSYFSEAEWRIVANVVGKAAGSIAEDLRSNDRVYVFAAGNDAEPEPNRPCEQDYVLGVAASMACDGSQGWIYTPTNEGTNMGAMLVAAPGSALITSTIFPCPNLTYLPVDEFSKPIENYAIPPRAMTWNEQTNHFNATSGATPQVSSLAALLYAQQPQRKYIEVIDTIKASTEGRALTAEWGRAQGLISYPKALGW